MNLHRHIHSIHAQKPTTRNNNVTDNEESLVIIMSDACRLSCGFCEIAPHITCTKDKMCKKYFSVGAYLYVHQPLKFSFLLRKLLCCHIHQFHTRCVLSAPDSLTQTNSFETCAAAGRCMSCAMHSIVQLNAHMCTIKRS